VNAYQYIGIIILIVYAVTLLVLSIPLYFSKTKLNAHDGALLPLSVIVCACNEEKYIHGCIDSLIRQEYPRDMMEVILVNDGSSDKTAAIAAAMLKNSGISHRIISNPVRKGKKKSLAHAIEQTSHDFIVTRDADTITRSERWLKIIAAYHLSSKADLVIGAVSIKRNTGLLWALQAIESQVLQFLTGGSSAAGMPFLCSGANLAFTKELYRKTNGYSTHIEIPSGDDILFLEDAKKITGVRIGFLNHRDGLVETFARASLASLIRQKVRWAGKFKVNKNPLNLFTAVVIFAANSAFLFYLFTGFVFPQGPRGAFIFVLAKLTLDFLLLLLTPSTFGRRTLLWYSLPVGFIYPFYAVLIGLRSLLTQPRWK
jgi:poly-beta-1,6-N-acetyl-D-glucosamine synthase